MSTEGAGPPAQWHQVVVAGRPLYTRVWAGPAAPAGPPIVLVHGLGVSSRYMVPLGSRLAGHRRVYALDLLGYGHSARPDHALSVAELAAVLAAWMRAVGLERAVFLGHSLGCQVVVALAARYPEYVERAVLACPTMDPGAPAAYQQVARLIWDAPREPPALCLLATADYLRAGPWRMAQTLQAALHDPLAGHLPAVRCPVLVVAGSRDPVVPAGWAAEVARRLPHGRLAVIRGAAHAVNYSHPAALTRVVLRFLRPAGRA